MLALLARCDETELLRRLISAEAERAAGPAPAPMSDEGYAALLARVEAQNDAEDSE